jgi:hypothetical protein
MGGNGHKLGFTDSPTKRRDGDHITNRKRAGSSSAQAWRYSAHELGAIDLIARERLRRCRDDIAWGDLWPSFGGAGLAVEKDS